MYSPPRSASPRRQAGFTLIELMVGIVIGLLASLAVTHVLLGAEGQKRTTTAGSDAQLNGALALDTLRRALLPAGYGFAAAPAIIGCPLVANYNGVAVPGLPATLAPVFITDGAAGAPDTIRVFASGKSNFSIPVRVVGAGYNPADPLANTKVQVAASVGVAGPVAAGGGNPGAPGDLILAAIDSGVNCEVFEVTSDPTDPAFIPRADAPARWNPVGFPAGTYGDGSMLINLGVPVDSTYTVANNGLRVSSLTLDPVTGEPSYPAATELYPDIVNLQVMYGKDTSPTPDGTVDAWDNVVPADNAAWRRVIAVRIAVVARSSQYEKEEVTQANPQWDVGTAIAIAGTVACGDSQCLPLVVDTLDDWKHYRYRVFDTIVPLRNMLWNS